MFKTAENLVGVHTHTHTHTISLEKINKLIKIARLNL